MQITKRFFSILGLLLFTIMLVSCKKDADDQSNGNNVAYIVPLQSEVFPYELVSLQIKNLDLTLNEYSAEIDNLSLTIGCDKETGLLAFIMPEISAGKKIIHLNIEGKKFETEIQIKSLPEIVAPEVVINKAIEDVIFTDKELDNIIEGMKGYSGSEFNSINATMLKKYAQDVQTIIKGLNTEEKRYFAAFITANTVLFEPLENPLNYIDSFSIKKIGESPEDVLDDVFNRMEHEKKKLFAIAALTVGSGLAGQPWLAAACGLVGIYKIYTINNNNIIGLEKALVRFGDMLVDDISSKKKDAVFTFYKDRKYLIRINSAYRTPNVADMNTQSTLMKGMIVSLDDVSDVWKKANNFISNFGYSLKGKPYHIKDNSKTKSKVIEVAPKFLLVSNISNPNVKGKWNLSSEGWILEFTTEEKSAQEFTIDIHYKSDLGESVLKLDGTLDPESKYYGWYVGQYTLLRFSGYNNNCNPKAGEKGDVFFYFTPDKIITYTKSILEGIPDIYDKNDGPFYPHPISGNDSLQFRHVGNIYNEYGVDGSFDLDYLNMLPGYGITSGGGSGFTLLRTTQGSGCDGAGNDYKFIYRMITSANYRGEEAPPELTAPEVKTIMEK